MAKGIKTGGGSRLGKPNGETKALREMILAALDANGGVEYLSRKAEEEPKAFLSLLGRVLPMTVAGDPNAPLQAEIRVKFVR